MTDLPPAAVPGSPDDQVVSYVFPIEVVVVGALTEEDHQAIEQRIWTSFNEALSRSA
jgi:hypothetical protein